MDGAPADSGRGPLASPVRPQNQGLGMLSPQLNLQQIAFAQFQSCELRSPDRPAAPKHRGAA
jgi:hypothetical protein